MAATVPGQAPAQKGQPQGQQAPNQNDPYDPQTRTAQLQRRLTSIGHPAATGSRIC